jgi:TPR repeat protein
LYGQVDVQETAAELLLVLAPANAPPPVSSPAPPPIDAPAPADPTLLALSQALEAINVGLAADCVDFAKKLTKEGVLSISRLKDLSEAEAVEVLEGCGMKKLQVRTVMKSFAPPSSAAAAAISPAPSPAPAPSPESLFQEGQQLYGEQRFSEAAERWGQAALLQHGPSHAHVSDMLIDGRPGVAKDYNRAFKLAAAGAALGCAHSKGALGRCYIKGCGVAKDEVRGFALGKDSEAAGSCFGQHVVAACYNVGYFSFLYRLRKDDAKAVRIYRLAAEQGHAPAQVNLGLMFEHGQGVAQDAAEAIRWYRLAAEQGHATAQVKLGHMFENGHGVAKDAAEAIRWYRLAAAQGDTVAQHHLKRLGA